MKYSPTMGAIIGGAQLVPAEVISPIVRSLPDKAFSGVRFVISCRTDSLLLEETINDMAHLMDIYGRAKQVGLSLEGLLNHIDTLDKRQDKKDKSYRAATLQQYIEQAGIEEDDMPEAQRRIRHIQAMQDTPAAPVTAPRPVRTTQPLSKPDAKPVIKASKQVRHSNGSSKPLNGGNPTHQNGNGNSFTLSNSERAQLKPLVAKLRSQKSSYKKMAASISHSLPRLKGLTSEGCKELLAGLN